jgi:hypothetical protein
MQTTACDVAPVTALGLAHHRRREINTVHLTVWSNTFEQQAKSNAPAKAEVGSYLARLEIQRINRCRDEPAVGAIQHASDQPAA